MAGFEAQFREAKNMNASFGQTQFVHTDDYNDLINQPSIEDVVLKGNKTFKQLGLESATVQEVEQILYLD